MLGRDLAMGAICYFLSAICYGTRSVPSQLRELTAGAIGVVAQAEVFENLHQSLLLVESPQMRTGGLEGAEQSGCCQIQSPMIELSRYLLQLLPDMLAAQRKERGEDVCDDIIDPRVTDQTMVGRYGLGG
jgi:hypothetical protein